MREEEEAVVMAARRRSRPSVARNQAAALFVEAEVSGCSDGRCMRRRRRLWSWRRATSGSGAVRRGGGASAQTLGRAGPEERGGRGGEGGPRAEALRQWSRSRATVHGGSCSCSLPVPHPSAGQASPWESFSEREPSARPDNLLRPSMAISWDTQRYHLFFWWLSEA